MITRAQLDQRLNQIIREICPNEYTSTTDGTHCAHYVSHVLGFRFGPTCKIFKDKGFPGACVQVAEIFHHCPRVGLWKDRPAYATRCLIFLADSAKIDLVRKRMKSVRQHVGIYADQNVWAYGMETRVSSFTEDGFSKLYNHKKYDKYKQGEWTIYYGTMPPG